MYSKSNGGILYRDEALEAERKEERRKAPVAVYNHPSKHSQEAMDACESYIDRRGGILLPSTPNDHFCYGYDFAMMKVDNPDEVTKFIRESKT